MGRRGSEARNRAGGAVGSWWRALALVATLASVLAPMTRPVPAGATDTDQQADDTDTTGDPAVDYMDAVYGMFLGRPPASSSVARWRPTVTWGDRLSLTRALSVSDEWAGSRVDDLYQDVFGRSADAAGRAHWVGRIDRGETLESVASFFFGSDEYFASRGSTPAAFVDALYAELLGRQADDDGRSHWVGEIDRGAPRSFVATGFYGSIESRDDRVTGMYDEILGRSPDDAGRGYWAGAVATMGDVTLSAVLAASDEFYTRGTGQQPPDTPRAAPTGFAPYATVEDVVLVHPAAAVERIGFHQSGHDGAQMQEATEAATRALTLPSRGRGTGLRTAADIVVAPGTEIRSPVSGVVTRAGTYRLYCRYRDDYVVVEPDAHPGWQVKVLHIDGVQVRPGDRVVAGETLIAPRPTILPFGSQVDTYTAIPAWPHVHVELVDPSIPDRPGGGC